MDRPVVAKHLRKIGAYLHWHGSLAIDYFYDETTGTPYYIDASPRLVEPMNAVINGINLPELQVGLSLAQRLVPQNTDTRHRKSHMTLLSLLGLAERGASRRELAAEFLKALFRRGIYAGSTEELTNAGLDFLSVIPLMFIALRLLLRPQSVAGISARTVTDYALTEASISTIEGLSDSSTHRPGR